MKIGVLGPKNTLIKVSLLACVFLIFLLLSGNFFFSQLLDASQKALWGDEVNGFSSLSRSYPQLLLKGIPGQGSPAPLDYIFIKFLNSIKEKVNYFSLPPRSYFRLFSNFITLFCLWYILFIFIKDIFHSQKVTNTQFVQLVLLTCIPIAFLYKEDIYLFAFEMRPYALWNSLWFLCCALSLYERKKKTFFLILLALSFSATAFIFQLFSLFLAYNLISLLQKKTIKEIVKSSSKLFLIPFLITIFYCLKSGKWSYTDPSWGTWSVFWNFWSGEFETFHIIIGVLILCLIKEGNRRYSILPLTMLFLYFSGPFIYWLTRSRGFFFTPRQYIYYNLCAPVALLTMIKCLPAYVDNIKNKKVILCVFFIFCMVAGAITFRKKNIRTMKASFQNTSLFFRNGLTTIEDEALKNK